MYVNNIRKRTAITTSTQAKKLINNDEITKYATRTTRRRERKPIQKQPPVEEEVELEQVLAAAEVVPAIKIEAFDDNEDVQQNGLTNNSTATTTSTTNLDIKPDVSLLDQQILQQTPQLQTINTTTTTSSVSTSSAQFVRLLVANSNNMLLATDASGILNEFGSTAGVVGQRIVDGRRIITLTPTGCNNAVSVSTPVGVVASNNTSAITLMSKLTEIGCFDKDDFDVQTSDSDEDGYSDLDLEDDDELIEGNILFQSSF